MGNMNGGANSNFNGKMNLDTLFNEQQQKFDNKIAVYNKILERAHNKIKVASRQKNNNCFCCYVVKEFILGLPRYDVSDCTAYIIEKLRENGFNVRYTYPNLLFISWAHYIPKYERTQYKKDTGINIDGFGNVKYKKGSNNNNNNGMVENDPFIKSNINVVKKEEKKTYKNISSYKPTGNMIYSDDLIKKINSNILK
tara:strand:+ start:865 stop:1455 length:591 start_codon:yes stop_codon:yes gene_type:complete